MTPEQKIKKLAEEFTRENFVDPDAATMLCVENAMLKAIQLYITDMVHSERETVRKLIKE